ncbi:26S proteasome regulatory subunit 6B [Perkinsus olseni]|uniref:26S proteasome regulatory subunit 6B n=1 Tax=Perkinsus olseni TaxID=32597 RepID=A0A7J6PRQ8_PEROL|nr:26S proteasome regulatory subunit 6B [Perkinsus olseni]
MPTAVVASSQRPAAVVDSTPAATSDDNIDMYRRFKELQKQLEQLDIQEEYIKYETKNLKREMVRAREEIQRVRSVPLVIGQFSEIIDAEHGIIQSSQGSSDYVRILSTINREDLKPGCSVALHRHSHAVVEILPPEADSTVQSAAMTEKPDVTYADIGGLDVQKQEIREAVELPLVQKDLYAQIGIDPPSGVLLYGPPGTGKTMLAKAVANHTTATFIRMVGSEFVQKYLGEGPRMVRDVFRLAREQAPSIVFIDEIDSIATKRFDAQTGADREVQRILLELLNQMDGFDQDTTVKVIMATNRADTLDPALLRPGRLDRKIEFPLPDRRQRRLIFQTITGKMNLSEDVDLEDFVSRPEKISAADIAAICQEAGMQAVRRNRYVVTQKDFEKGWKEHVRKKDRDFEFYALSERTLPLRRARAASEGSLTSPYSGRRSLSTDAFGGSGATSASSRGSTDSTSPTESARSLRRQRRAPDRFGEAVPYHYHCPYCEHSCSGTAEEIIMHARVAHRIRVTASHEDCRPREGKREMTLEDPLSPSRLSEGPSDEGSTKKVRFNSQVRVRLMDSDASRVEKLGSILGDDPGKEVFARGWLNAAVESAVGSESSWMSDVATTSNDYQQTS